MKLEITLIKKIKGKNDEKSKTESKKYTVYDPSLKMVRKAVEMYTDGTLSIINPDTMDKIGQFAVELFENQFTLEDLYEGLPAEGGKEKMFEPVIAIMDTLGVKLNQVPQAEAEEQEK